MESLEYVAKQSLDTGFLEPQLLLPSRISRGFSEYRVINGSGSPECGTRAVRAASHRALESGSLLELALASSSLWGEETLVSLPSLPMLEAGPCPPLKFKS